MKDLAGKKLLILGGSRISSEIVRKAQALGIHTAVTDFYPVEKSPAKQLADEAFLTSTSDIAAMVELIQDEKFDGVLTGFTDSVLPYYAEICVQAGLPCYGTKEQFEILTNKRAYKQLCREFGVPVVEEYDIETDNLSEISYPVLVKPADNSGARGISVCTNPEELKAGHKKAMEFSAKKQVLVERYLDGEEVTVFYTLQDGEIYLSGMGNRHIKHNQAGVIALPVAYTFPSVHLHHYVKNTDQKVQALFRSLDMKDGIVFLQCLVEDGEAIIYDIGYRLTGTQEYKIIEAVSGYHPLEMMINHALTGEVSEPNLSEKATPFWEKYACNVSFLGRPGVIDKITGLEDIQAMPNVLDAVLANVEGDEILPAAKGTLKQIILRVFAVADSEAELTTLLDTIYDKLEVTSTEGESMLLPGFDTSELKAGAFA